MEEISKLEPLDYLIIGHLTVDRTPDGPRLGGTVTYSGLTARALGLKVGIVTSWGSELPLGELSSIPIVNHLVDVSTTFENVQTDRGRTQKIFHTASQLGLDHIPEAWRNASIVHLAPIAREVETSLVHSLSNPLVAVTPQGWVRDWDREGRVFSSEWPDAVTVLQRAGAAVISVEDVNHDEERIEEMAASCPVLAVTEAECAVRLYWHGDVRRFKSPVVPEVDPTGAGDIFAAAFFTRLYATRDPWEAARFATRIAAISVTRTGLEAIPTADEIKDCLVEVF